MFESPTAGSWYLTLALLAFHRRNYRQTLRFTETPSRASAERQWSLGVMKHPTVPLMRLQAIFEGLLSAHAQRTLH
jgi:hypothetical protein